MADFSTGGFSEPRIGATPRDEDIATQVLSVMKENVQLRRHPLQVLV